MKNTYIEGQLFLSDIFDCFNILPEVKSVDDFFLDCVLHGSGFEDGKIRIFDIINSDLSASEQASKIKSEYGIGGSYFACMHAGEPSVLTGYGFDAKGLKIRYQDENVEVKEHFFSWIQVRNAIEEQIRRGKYLDASEKENVERKLA